MFFSTYDIAYMMTWYRFCPRVVLWDFYDTIVLVCVLSDQFLSLGTIATQNYQQKPLYCTSSCLTGGKCHKYDFLYNLYDPRLSHVWPWLALGGGGGGGKNFPIEIQYFFVLHDVFFLRVHLMFNWCTSIGFLTS